MEYKKINTLLDSAKHAQSMRNNTIFVENFDEEDFYFFQYYIDRFIKLDKIRKNKTPIKIDISSYGGNLNNIFGMLSILESLKEKGYIIKTHCSSKAMSAGLFLLAIGGSKGYRTAGKYAELLLHEQRNFTYGISTHIDKKREYEYSLKTVDLLSKLMEDNTNTSKEQFMNKIDGKEDWVVYAYESIEQNLGWIDKII